MKSKKIAIIVLGLTAILSTVQADSLWHDDYTNTVTSTGETKSYPNHERNIPGNALMQVKDRASAEAVWSNQGGRVIEYSGSIDSGKITVIVDFGYIKDTHVYVRDK